ncbi:MAG: hypothetical protein E7523_08650 [Ruminococcaceae bacterium]|nr:hypothetical protein [Oscillospiraceae bacterium]
MDANKKNKKKHRDPVISESDIPSVELFHEKLLASSQIEKPVTDVYDVFDNDLARDNMENDMPEPEIEAMRRLWP